MIILHVNTMHLWQFHDLFWQFHDVVYDFMPGSKWRLTFLFSVGNTSLVSYLVMVPSHSFRPSMYSALEWNWLEVTQSSRLFWRPKSWLAIVPTSCMFACMLSCNWLSCLQNFLQIIRLKNIQLVNYACTSVKLHKSLDSDSDAETN